MLLTTADSVMAERLRTAISDAIAPMVEVMSRPAGTVANTIDNVRELSGIREENRRLREENALLMQWQTAARQLEAQNDSLKELLNFVPQPGSTFVSARVVADTGGAFAQSLLVTAGERELVAKGQAVVSGEGLVGRIAEVGRRSARVLLVTDINSRIPVSVGNSRQRAILAGDNSSRQRLVYLRAPQSIVPGDRVVTSGAAGAFPPGIPVGVVTSVNDTDIRMEPFLRRDRLEYVRVVDYGLSGILQDVIDPSAEEAAH
jgi:rod shape-determining protein MreC